MEKIIYKKEITIDARGVHFAELNKKIKQVINEYKDERVLIVLKNVLGQRYIGDGISGDISARIYGTPGNDLGAFMDGPTIEVFGNGQDGIGNTMNSGTIIVHGDCGDIAGYSMRGGSIYVRGNVGWRSGIHMKSYLDKFPVIVVGGRAGNFLGEYMAGGIIIVLGLNDNTIYIRENVKDYKLGKEVKSMDLDENDRMLLSMYINNFCDFFNLSYTLFTDRDFKNFIKLAPYSHRPYGKLYAY